MSDVRRLLDIMARLRDPEKGCPWDVEQRFETIAPYTVEEAYEVADAIERGDREALRGELGDLLFQVVFHSRLAEEAHAFDAATVCDVIVAKLVHRHPHVFGDETAESADDVLVTWEARKRVERSHTSAFDDVPAALPSLTRAAKIQKRAVDRAGVPAPDALAVAARLRSVLDEVEVLVSEQRADAEGTIDQLVGRALFLLAALSRATGGSDPEGALRATTRTWEESARAAESRGELGGSDFLHS